MENNNDISNANITNESEEHAEVKPKRGRPKLNKPKKEVKPVGRPKTKPIKPKTARKIANSFTQWREAKERAGIKGKVKKGSDEYKKIDDIYQEIKKEAVIEGSDQ